MKKQIFLFLLITVFTLQKLNAQIASFQWLNAAFTYPPAVGIGGGESIEVDLQGNIYASGGSLGGGFSTFGDVRLSKFTNAGQLIWSFSVQNAGTSLAKIKLDNLGNIYFAGNFQGNMIMSPGDTITNNVGSEDIFLAKYDTAGNFIWAFAIGSPSLDYIFDLNIDNSGNPIICGRFGVGTIDFDPGNGTANLNCTYDYNGFLAKYSSAGNYIYAKQIRGIIQPPQIHPGRSIIYSMVVDNSDNIYLAGTFNLKCDFDFSSSNTTAYRFKGAEASFFAKYDANTNLIFVKILSENETDPHDGYEVNSLDIELDNSNIVISGNFNDTIDFNPGSGTNKLISQSGIRDGFIARYDNNGNYIWAKKILNVINAAYGNPSIAVDNNGNTYLHAGNGGGNLSIYKFNSSGIKIFEHLSYTSGDAGEIVVDNNSNFYLTALGGGKAFVGDLDFSPASQLMPTDQFNNVYPPYIAKYHECSTCPTPLATLSNLTSNSVKVNWSIIDCSYKYQIQYRIQGTTTWSSINILDPIITKKISGLSFSTTYEYRIRTQCDNSGYSPYSTIQTFTTNAIRTGETINSPISSLNIYPNPASDVLIITFQSEKPSIKIEILNITGQIVYQKQLGSADENYICSINISSLPRGFYSLKLIDESGFTARKFIKQ